MKIFLVFVFMGLFFNLSSCSQSTQEVPVMIAHPFEDIQSQEIIDAKSLEMKAKFNSSIMNFSIDHVSEILGRYSHIDPNNEIPDNLLARALVYFDENRASFENTNHMSIVDFSDHSKEARFFIVEMLSGEVTMVRTAHGSGGDRDNDGYVEKVSNVSGSHQSSKGFYQVSEIYYGKYGRSIRLDGLSDTNSKVRARAIVIHGSDYVRERDKKQGMSWGCFALAWSVKDDVVDLIHGGSLLYADFSGDY